MMTKRVYIKGGTYFFTVNLLDRKATLLTDQFSILRKSMFATAKTLPFRIVALVVLPEHMHMVMHLPQNDDDFSSRIKCIKSLFSKEIEKNENISPARMRKGERGIWQRRFWEHVIRDEADFEHHINYIHYNPVKHGYALKPTDWVYSTIHAYIQRGDLQKNWASNQGCDSRNYGE